MAERERLICAAADLAELAAWRSLRADRSASRSRRSCALRRQAARLPQSMRPRAGGARLAGRRILRRLAAILDLLTHGALYTRDAATASVDSCAGARLDPCSGRRARRPVCTIRNSPEEETTISEPSPIGNGKSGKTGAVRHSGAAPQPLEHPVQTLAFVSVHRAVSGAGGSARRRLHQGAYGWSISGVIASDQASADSVISSLQGALRIKKTIGRVLRINSPGGSPGSRAIYDEIQAPARLHPRCRCTPWSTTSAPRAAITSPPAPTRSSSDKASIVGSIAV